MLIKHPHLKWVILVILMVFAYVTALNVLRDLLIIMLLTMFLGYIQINCGKHAIQIGIDVEQKEVEKGESFLVNLKLTNKISFPTPYIMIILEEKERIHPKETREVCVLLDTKETKVISLAYEAKYVGCEKLTIKEVVLLDYFKLSICRLKVNQEVALTILPRIEKVTSLQSRIRSEVSSPWGNNLETLAQGIGEVGYELDNYRIGDSEKLIHWKILMQRDEWLVRKRESYKASSYQIRIVIDPVMGGQSAAHVELQDELLTSAISLLAAVLKTSHDVQCSIYEETGWENYLVAHEGDLAKLAGKMSRCKFVLQNDLAVERIPYDDRGIQEGKREIWVLSQYINEHLVRSIRQMASESIPVTMIEVVNKHCKLEEVATKETQLMGELTGCEYWRIDETYSLMRIY